jgi:hypothetical protein
VKKEKGGPKSGHEEMNRADRYSSISQDYEGELQIRSCLCNLIAALADFDNPVWLTSMLTFGHRCTVSSVIALLY